MIGIPCTLTGLFSKINIQFEFVLERGVFCEEKGNGTTVVVGCLGVA